jgi:hypothetical protein
MHILRLKVQFEAKNGKPMEKNPSFRTYRTFEGSEKTIFRISKKVSRREALD